MADIVYDISFVFDNEKRKWDKMGPQKAGYYGDDKAARITFSRLSEPCGYQIEIVDGNGAYDITRVLQAEKDEEGFYKVTFLIPASWTAAGLASVRLISVGLADDRTGAQIVHYPEVYLLFEARESGSGDMLPQWQSVMRDAMSEADNANQAAEDAKQATDNANQAAGVANQAAKDAESAAGVANQAATKAEENMPSINEDGMWCLGEKSTGVQAKGEKGDPFEYSDFTEEQLAQLKGEKGDPFEYSDFTEEQLAQLKGEVTYAYAHTNLSNALKGKVEGNPVVIKDASPLEHEVAAKVPPNPNLLPNIEGDTIENVTLSKTSDGGYVLTGTPETGDLVFRSYFTLEEGTYVLSANNEKALNGMEIIVQDTYGNQTTLSLDVENAHTTITVSYATEFEFVIAGYGIFSPIQDFTLNPQLTKPITTVTKYGKNLFTIQDEAFDEPYGGKMSYDSETQIVTVTGKTEVDVFKFDRPLPVGTTFSITLKMISGKTTDQPLKVMAYSLDGGSNPMVGIVEAKSTVGFSGEVYTGTFTAGKAVDTIHLSIYRTTDVVEPLVFQVQFELGDLTEYEPYVEPVTRDAGGNGVVSGITVDGNGATLFADNGATITAEYNRDINKAFAELQALILGG